MDEKTIELIDKLLETSHTEKSHVWAKNDMVCSLADTVKSMLALPDDEYGLEGLSKDSEYEVYETVVELLVNLKHVMKAYEMTPNLLNWILQEKLDSMH